MVQQYNALEGSLSVRGAATSSRTGTTNAVAIVGGYDSANADADVTAGEATLIEDETAADTVFGDSEIPRAAQAASANGVGTIYGVPVPETEVTGEDPSSGTSGELANAPVFNPNLHPDHDITEQNGNEINVSYDVASETVDATEAYVNPVTGNFKGDSGTTYSVDYTYGDYSDAITAAADLPVRYVIVLTEADSVKATLVSELSSIANDFDFKRGVVGAEPAIEAGSISSYTPSQEDWRLVEVAPALGTGAEGPVRTCAAVGGFMAAQPIGPDGSSLYDSVNGLTALNTSYRPSEAKDFDGVTALTREARVATAETTSTDNQFRLVYATEIIDDVALDLFNVARDYAGGPQDIGDLQSLLEVQCEANARGNPPNLGFAQDRDGDPYDVNVSLGSSDTVANAGVTIVPYPIAETVNISITVSDGFVQFEGAQ